MDLRETGVIYAVLGMVVGLAQMLRQRKPGGLERITSVILAVVLWPLFAPLLLADHPAPRPSPPPTLDGRIATIQASLLASLGRLRGVAEEMLAPEAARIRGLGQSITAMEQRLAEMDKLLASPELSRVAADDALRGLLARGLPDSDPRVQSVRARLRNIERLQSMRTGTTDSLERIVLKLEEMSSQLQLLELAGRPDTEVVGMIKDIADTVEGVAEGLLPMEPAV